MSSLFLLATLAGIVYLIFWMIQNDGAKDIGDQQGLLRMAVPAATIAPPDENAKAPKRRAPPARPAGAKFPERPPNSQRGPQTLAKDRAAETDAEEEIIHPLWRGRPRKHRP